MRRAFRLRGIENGRRPKRFLQQSDGWDHSICMWGEYMNEQALLRYRMAVAEQMPDSPSKQARMVAIQSRLKSLSASKPK